LDTIPVNEVRAWESQFRTFLHHQKPEIVEELQQKKDLSDDLIRKIDGAIKEFHAQYASGEAAEAEVRERDREAVTV
jgi:F-type H+-transporting ATPase subunit alpha